MHIDILVHISMCVHTGTSTKKVKMCKKKNKHMSMCLKSGVAAARRRRRRAVI